MGWNTFIILQHTSTCTHQRAHTHTDTHSQKCTCSQSLRLWVSGTHTHIHHLHQGLISHGCFRGVWNSFVLALSLNPSDSNEATLITHPQFQITAEERLQWARPLRTLPIIPLRHLSLVHFRFLISAKLIHIARFYSGVCVYWYLRIARCQQNKCVLFSLCNACDLVSRDGNEELVFTYSWIG